MIVEKQTVSVNDVALCLYRQRVRGLIPIALSQVMAAKNVFHLWVKAYRAKAYLSINSFDTAAHSK